MISGSFFLNIWMNLGLVYCHIIPDILPIIMDEFKIYQPIILQENILEIRYMTEVVKNLNYHGYSIDFNHKQHINQYQSCVIFTEDLIRFKWNNPTYAPILIVSKIQTEEDLKEIDVSIGSEVIFLDWVSLKVYESYNINTIQITRFLGQFQESNSGKAAAKFVQSKDYISNMENRRCDFYGIQLKSLIPKLRQEDPENYPNLVQFFPNNDTYDITKLTNNPKYYGKVGYTLPLKIVKLMERKFNFTLSIFLRRDQKFGSPHISSNGSTVIGEGVFKNLVHGSIDFATGYFTMSPIRSQFADFLPTIWSYHDAIFVPIEDSSEEIDWNVFFEPFAIKTWIAIAIKCIIFTLLVSIIEWFHKYKLVRPQQMIFHRKKPNIVAIKPLLTI